MDIKEMMAAIDAKVNTDAENKKAENEKIAEKAREDIRKILAFCPEICELEKVVDSLFSNGLVKRDCWGDNSRLLTNAITHHLGFCGGCGPSAYGRVKPLFGITGGGCDGASVYVDYRGELIVVRGTPMSEYEVVEKAVADLEVRTKLDKIANCFTKYREYVENFVKALGK